MPTTDLKLDECGTLPRPGPLGRLYRLGMGYVVLYHLAYQIWDDRVMLVTGEFEPYGLIWSGTLIGLFLISYVINIGFSRHWKKWPAILSAAFLGALALYDQTTTGDWTGQAFGTGFFVWTMYIYIHLGVCFVLSAIIGTPGCEMRALHDLFSRVTKIETKEHFCPVGIMQPLDNWESKQFWWKKYA